MSRKWVASMVLGLALAGSQAGHLLAYELRFGPAAQQLQGAGSHAYFPLLVKTSLGLVALALVASIFLIGFARVVSGKRIDRQSSPSLLRMVAALYAMQLAFFLVQEILEGSSAGELLLWGMLGQLPVAAAGALALRWVLATLGPALAAIIQRCERLLAVRMTSVVARPAAVFAVVASTSAAGPISRRGPPPSF